MRDIKFRGVRIDNLFGGEIVLFELGDIRFPEGYKDSKTMRVRDKKGNYSIIISTESIVQFTGLQDRNGVDIYEGDIVDDQFNCGQLKRIYYNGDNASFMGECLGIKGLGSKGNYCVRLSVCPESTTKGKVIGNIHQNPELLGGAV